MGGEFWFTGGRGAISIWLPQKKMLGLNYQQVMLILGAYFQCWKKIKEIWGQSWKMTLNELQYQDLWT